MQFVLNDNVLEEPKLPAELTILRYLRETKNLVGSKEGCASGDCGACTVLVGSLEKGTIRYQVVNACIAPMASVKHKHLVTVEHLAKGDNLHPAQRAMVEQHGSQCGFCTPGFVMSLAALYSASDARINTSHPDHGSLVGRGMQSQGNAQAASGQRERVCEAISGNLCRCTGYRPIVEAGLSMLAEGDEQRLLHQDSTLAALKQFQQQPTETAEAHYFIPTSLDELNRLLQLHSGAKLIAGGTDLMLDATQKYQDFAKLIDVSRVAELQQCLVANGTVAIGAAVTYRQLEQDLAPEFPAMLPILKRLGSPQIRNRGTLGGNLGNASPIADMPPILLAVDAKINIGSANAHRRQVPIDNFYTAYRQTVLAADEYIMSAEFAQTALSDFLRFYKISKRIEDDISSVMLALRWALDEQGRIREARIAFGGVAATPVRAKHCEMRLTGAALDDGAALEKAIAALAEELQPLSDVRASAAYRLAMAGNLLRKAWHEAQGESMPNLGFQNLHRAQELQHA